MTTKFGREFGRVCRRFRINMELSLTDVGRRGGLSRITVCNIELGRNGGRLETAAAVARGLGVRLSAILKLVEDRLDKEVRRARTQSKDR